MPPLKNLHSSSIHTMTTEKSEASIIISEFVRLTEIEGKGRGLVACQPLKGGQIILQESPILTFSAFPLIKLQQHQLQRRQEDSSSCTVTTTAATTTTYIHSKKYCANCYQCLELEGFSCPSCSHLLNDVVFCSSKCQSLALTTTHTPWLCYALAQLRHCSLLLDHPCQEHQVLARYLVAAYNLAMTSAEGFEKLLSLEGDGKGREMMETAMFLHSIITSTLSFPEELSPNPTVEITAALLGKESCNSFSLMEPYTQGGGRSARAYGIYKNASYFNHDCLPNACRFDYLDTKTTTTTTDHDQNQNQNQNTDIVIRMIHDVPQGKEVCLSYFRVGLSYRERRRRLLGYFGFACFCDRCKLEMNETNDDNNANVVGGSLCNHFFARFMCERENCGGTLAPLPPSSNTNSGDPLMMNVMECNFCGNLKKNKI